MSVPKTKISQADKRNLFGSGLEYNPPARGNRNIVHTGFLMPEARQIFVCARGCLRGVILTAAEMNAMDRMSWVGITESDMLSGDLEENVYLGTVKILDSLDKRPPAVELFISCIQLFAGIDFASVLDRLRERYPDVEFIDCYMNPTMRKSGLTPDQIMRERLYAPLKKHDTQDSAVNIIGNDVPTASELTDLLESSGFEIRDVTKCKTYAEFLEMGKSSYNIAYFPPAYHSAQELEKRIGNKTIITPLSYSFDEIRSGYEKLFREIDAPLPDLSEYEARAKDALKRAAETLVDTPVAIDYMSSSRPFSMARLLLDSGINVVRLYVDGVSGEDSVDFDYIQKKYPDLELVPTLDTALPFERGSGDSVVAIGQKAAYFEGTSRFVNMVFSNGAFGFYAVEYLGERLREACFTKSDVKTLISHKGMGCQSCLF